MTHLILGIVAGVFFMIVLCRYFSRQKYSEPPPADKVVESKASTAVCDPNKNFTNPMFSSVWDYVSTFVGRSTQNFYQKFHKLITGSWARILWMDGLHEKQWAIPQSGSQQSDSQQSNNQHTDQVCAVRKLYKTSYQFWSVCLVLGVLLQAVQPFVGPW